MINLAQKDIAHSFGKFIITSMGVGMLRSEERRVGKEC